MSALDDLGIDTITGELLIAASASSIRPLMPMSEFLQTFGPFGGYREPAQLQQLPAALKSNFPVCRFDRTWCLNGVKFLISLQFSDTTLSSDPDLRHIRMFATKTAWKRRDGAVHKLRKFFSKNPLMVGVPDMYESMERQREVYGKWLREVSGRDDHEQQYQWGHLNLVNSRQECFHIQIDYSAPSEEGAS